MIVRSEKTLRLYRGPGCCFYCGRWREHLDAHHAIVRRGVGGGFRLDLPEQLCGLCRRCHDLTEAKPPVFAEVAEKVARREGLTVAEIRDWLRSVSAAPKSGPVPPRPWQKVEASV